VKEDPLKEANEYANVILRLNKLEDTKYVENVYEAMMQLYFETSKRNIIF